MPTEMPVKVENTGIVPIFDAFHRAEQGFEKLFAASSSRVPQANWGIDEVKRAGCHRARSYPKSKRPGSALDSALIFMARLVSDPIDIRVFGWAIATPE